MVSGTPGNRAAGTVEKRAPLKPLEDLRCDECGTFGSFDLGDRHLCEDCYRTCGSCCLEFGANDLWAEDE